MVILIVKHGAIIRKRGSTLVVSKIVKSKDSENEEKSKYETVTVPLIDIEMLVIVGSRVRLSSGVILMLSLAQIPIIVHSRRADSIIYTPFYVRIADVRRRFYKLLENYNWKCAIASAFVRGKIKGMLNIARYFTYKAIEKGNAGKYKEYLDVLKQYDKEVVLELSCVERLEDIRSLESVWSKRLWELIKLFIPKGYEFTGREPKAKDPINSAISFTYAIIYGLCTHALIAAGLDPYAGILHAERAGRTSLTYDFSEMFKPVAIHAVLVSSRIADLNVGRDGYLTSSSLRTVTKILYKTLRRRHRSWRYTVRGEIYAKAWELRQNIEKATKFHPFIYSIK